MSERKKSPIRSSKIQICVAAILIILAVAMPIYSRYLEYRNGLSGEGPGGSVFLTLCFVFPLTYLLAILSLIAGIIHICRHPRSFRKGIVAVIIAWFKNKIGGILISISAIGLIFSELDDLHLGRWPQIVLLISGILLLFFVFYNQWHLNKK